MATFHQGSIGAKGSANPNNRRVKVISTEGLSTRELLELETCPLCWEKAAPGGSDTVPIKGQKYHWSEVLKGEHRLNGHKQIYDNLKEYKQELIKKSKTEVLTSDERYELSKIKEISFLK